MAVPSFIFGGDTNETPETLKRKRAIAQALMQRASLGPKNVGEGLSAIGNSLVYRSLAGKIDNADTAGRENAQRNSAALYGSIVGPSASTGSAADIGLPGAAAEVSATNPTPTTFGGDQKEFVASLLPAAMEESKRTGVDPRIIVAQAALESNYGKSAPGNNYFGIKSHGKDGGNSLMTSEVINGKTVRVRDNFRAYENPSDSVRGYGDFILENPRYKDFRSASGLDDQIAALQASGYATDPNYGRKISSIARGIQLPEVASLDPTAGMTSAADAIDAVAPASGYGDPMVSTPNAAPMPSAAAPFDMERFGGPNPVAAALSAPPQGQAAPQQASPVAAALASPQGALPALPATNVPSAPNVATGAPVTQPQQVAQAGQSPLMGGAFPPRPEPASSGPSMAVIQNVLNDPYASEADKAYAQTMLQRRLDAADPNKALDARLKEAQIEALSTKADKEPDAIRTLRIRAKDAGLREGTPEYQRFMATGGDKGPLVSFGNGDKFTEESDKAAAGRLNDYVSAGSAAPQMISDLQTLADLGREVNTGKGAQVKLALGPYAEAMGVDIAGLGPLQAYQAVVSRLAPQMRPAGSGATSDFDARQFLAALPSLGNTPEGNQLIIDTFASIQKNKIDAAEIASRSYLPKDQGGITWQEAEKQIRALGNPYEAFKKLHSKGGEKSPPDATTEPRKITTQDEFNALPSGTEFIAPDGSRRRKQ